MKRSSLDISEGVGDDVQEGRYMYGLNKLPSNCCVIAIDLDGQKDFSGIRFDDRVLVSNCIQMACELFPSSNPVSKKCDVVITSIQETVNDLVRLDAYVVLFQFHIDTIFEVQHLAAIQHINPLRCGTEKSIKTFVDTVKNKHCLMLTIASTLSPLVPTSALLFVQNFSSPLMTSDQDETSSKNDLREQSVNRKRARKNEISYSKICDNK